MRAKSIVKSGSFVLLVAVVVVLWQLSWSKLPYYAPDTTDPLPERFRTMAEHDQMMAGEEWPYIVRADNLLYYGSRHTSDPDDPQIEQIVDLWEDFRPTVAVTENRLGFLIGGLSWGVRAFGEFACAFALARRDNIPVFTLEPSWEAEVAEMKSVFPTEEVTLFYTLRVFLSERGEPSNRDRGSTDALAAHLLGKRGSMPGLEGSLPDIAALDALWEERFAAIGAWRDMPANRIHPSPDPSRLQRLANHANAIRDRHAARVILDLLDQGERVFAIAGGSHVVKQELVVTEPGG